MSTPASSGIDQRAYWVRTLRKIVGPVFSALARAELKKLMPVGNRPGQEDRSSFTHLQALANSLQGAAPWLCLRGLSGEEENARLEMLGHVRAAVANATDPESPDLVNFTEGRQTIVDAAVFSLALLRSRESVWNHLGAEVRANVIRCLKATRKQNPPFNNWLLFAATTEAFLCAIGEDWDRMRIDYAIRQHEQWYKGDGMYGDGPFFHFDYYNSFVIQPMLAEVLQTVSMVTHEWDAFQEPALKRIQRYSQVLERMIAPDGSFPPLGRSLAGRTAAFHVLAHTALRQALPSGLSPAQVRCALDAVLRRVMEAGGDIRCQRVAARRLLRQPTLYRRAICLHREPLHEHRNLPPARPPARQRILAGAGRRMDPGESLVRKGRRRRPLSHRLRFAYPSSAMTSVCPSSPRKGAIKPKPNQKPYDLRHAIPLRQPTARPLEEA